MPQNIALFCDFDGTITRTDLTDAVLEAFALPEFKDWEQRWRTGEIGSQECLSRQVELIQADRATLIAFAREFPIDEGIHELDRCCTANGAPLTIVSDGIDLFIHTVLQQHGLSHIPVFANQFTQANDQKVSLVFPHARPTCLTRAGTCKCAIAFAPTLPTPTVVYIGDGLSDCCVARSAQKVFAKDALLEWRQQRHLPCESFTTLTQVAHRLFPESFWPERTI
jgi:2-hydroxy-3-keto-5-methylthiopentenyl-1-phosphate phosphatase